jgi:hypothetical protein
MGSKSGGPVMSRLTNNRLLLVAVSVGWLAMWLGPASAQQSALADTPHSPPFTATLSNNTPLVSGMGVEGASRALGQQLRYVSGPPGSEIYLAIRNLGGSGLFDHNDRLYLQFRNGKLAGWKGDWGHNWMWQ